jgi:tRNA nucleotidyltransferase (CCA-adding enzyme)
MHVILTHEQADFDAIAAMLGAALLNEGAFPVLPHRFNRNVHTFLNLYGPELPFIEARDLPGGAVSDITLVDTQSLVTLKGAGRNTMVTVVDHHAFRPDLPVDWKITGERLGACTTLFVEDIRRQNLTLTSMQATLLLLGIYEDTGSLIYAGTTPRDVLAVAYLLEQGASLRMAAKYLNPPLSGEQRELYDQFLASIEPHHINGQNIMITRAHAVGMTGEISSVAHKLRDLLEPDALFLLVNTDEGVRLVARSTTDTVNVASVATHFGGGGHERAAAALVHPDLTKETLEIAQQRIYQELLELLPKVVKPSISVGHIMSKKPLLLSPDTTAEDALRLMQRYGYEGYPVVENGKVIGLLTRRTVDRALAHKLNLTAVSLMDAGEITVNVSDGLEKLQRLMASSGWGQVPVVQPGSGEVIGIVTRTDLLKSLAAEETQLPGRQNLAERLEKALSPTRLAFLHFISVQAAILRMPVYIVGGFVRDLVLDRPSTDFDIVVEGDAITLANHLAKNFGGHVVSHGRFGTSKWRLGSEMEGISAQLEVEQFDPADLPVSLDLVSARTEFYDYPTALPTVERSGIKLDLHRRDFTINTMAMRLDGRHYGDLYDYWGGLNDVRRGWVRVLHSLSFVDDPTRMLRAVRFEQRFNFHIEERTLQLIDEAKNLLRQVSGDRLRHEFTLILEETEAARQLQRLDDLGLLNHIHPALRWSEAYRPAVEAALTGRLDETWQLAPAQGGLAVPEALAFLAWLGELEGGEALAVGDRLRFARPLMDALKAVCLLREQLPDLLATPPSYLTGRLDAAPPMALAALDAMGPEETIRPLLRHYREEWQRVQPITKGDDLRALGIPPGPTYKYILSSLRSAWLDGSITDAAGEKALLDSLLETPLEPDNP